MHPKALALSSRRSSKTWATWSRLGNVISAKKKTGIFCPYWLVKEGENKEDSCLTMSTLKHGGLHIPIFTNKKPIEKGTLCLWSQMTPPFPRRRKASEITIASQGSCNEFWQNFGKIGSKAITGYLELMQALKRICLSFYKLLLWHWFHFILLCLQCSVAQAHSVLL